ncbi:hypothetical protein OA405_00060 [Bacteroidota bacterium]|nr:hypothetical protein [Bacteroidota bacterium]
MNNFLNIFSKKTLIKSIKDFSSLFFSNVLQKIFGLIREPVLAFVFGTSNLFANYLMIKTVSDFISQFTVGNSLRANLLPKFTKFYNDNQQVSLKNLNSFVKKINIYIFIFTQILQSLVIFYFDFENKLVFFLVSLFLSFVICFNFYNTVFLTILQAKGNFLKYAKASVLNAFVSVCFLYPLTLFFSVIGIVISRFLGIITLTLSYVLPMSKENRGSNINVSYSDFNIYLLILNNVVPLTIITTKFFSGIDGSNTITYFTYAVFILNAIFTAVITNLNTLILKYNSIVKNNIRTYFSIVLVIFLGISFYSFINFYGDYIIEIIFMRGAFKISDVLITSSLLQKITIPFLLIFTASILFQTFFSQNLDKHKSKIKVMSILFISFLTISYLLISFLNHDHLTSVIYFTYIISIFLIIMSLYSFIISSNENK